MSERSPVPWAIAVILLGVSLLPPAAAHGPGDTADVTIEADDSAAAVCQLLVLVNALIILDAEDSLGLIAPVWTTPARVVVQPQLVTTTAQADCSVVIEQLDVVFRDSESPMLRARNLVTGPPSVLSMGGRPGIEWDISVTGTGSEARVCQVVVILGSIIIGGGAFGILPGDLPIIDMNAESRGSGPNGSASCRSAIEDLSINGVSQGPVEAKSP